MFSPFYGAEKNYVVLLMVAPGLCLWRDTARGGFVVQKCVAIRFLAEFCFVFIFVDGFPYPRCLQKSNICIAHSRVSVSVVTARSCAIFPTIHAALCVSPETVMAALLCCPVGRLDYSSIFEFLIPYTRASCP